ncbi:MAG: hypothetical protein H0W77_04270 [Acidobacteria bacterium]|nr:hypothetical protein [Acidobacteriota bacterium]
MKIKVLAILGLATFIGLVGCRGAANTNTTVVTNTSTMNTNMAMATPMAMADTATQKTVEDALKKAGLNDVTVSATTAEVTLRGSVAKGKLTEAVRIATEAGKKKVNNQLVEK